MSKQQQQEQVKGKKGPHLERLDLLYYQYSFFFWLMILYVPIHYPLVIYIGNIYKSSKRDSLTPPT